MSSEVHDTEMLISDTDLLGDYLATGDADSFTQIVKRHSALVMGVCKRATGNVHDAEDAFQSTFMVLAKNASKVRKVESLPSWLYGVAFRVAMRLNKVRTRLKTMTDELDVPVRDDPFEELNVQFLHQKTDEAIQRLPDKLRGPIVLRYLMGKSNAEVAESLSVNVSTVEGRL